MNKSESGERLRRILGSHAVELPEFEVLSPAEVPEPFHELLVHDQHMTVTLEQFHGARVQLHVLAREHHDDEYARMILLSLEGTQKVVEFGAIRMDLSCCEEAVRKEILTGSTPLGRILIEHDVLRHIDVDVYLKIEPTAQLREWFGMDQNRPLFGRLASIFCNNRPAIELLEVVGL